MPRGVKRGPAEGEAEVVACVGASPPHTTVLDDSPSQPISYHLLDHGYGATPQHQIWREAPSAPPKTSEAFIMASKRRKIQTVNIADQSASDIINNWLQDDDVQSEDEDTGGRHATDFVPELYFDDDDADFIISDHDTGSECSDSEEQDSISEELPMSSNYLYGKNRFKWSTTPPSRNVRTASHNIIQLPPQPPVRNLNPIHAFGLIFDSNMLNIILTWTNKKLEQLRENHPSSKKHFRETSQIVMKRFIVVLIYTSVFKSSHESVLSLFPTDGTGREITRATISKNRFCDLLIVLRFYDFGDRAQRILDDPEGPITKLLSIFVCKSQNNYTVGSNVTINEKLIKFSGRSKFKMYMQYKPGKYALKMQLLVQSESFYTYNDLYQHKQ